MSPDPQRPRTPQELAQAIVRLVGAHRVRRVVGLTPVSPPEGHAFYAFVVLGDDAPDARVLEARFYDRFSPRRPRMEFWVMGHDEWERSRQRAGHPARSAEREGEVLYTADAAEVEASVA